MKMKVIKVYGLPDRGTPSIYEDAEEIAGGIRSALEAVTSEENGKPMSEGVKIIVFSGLVTDGLLGNHKICIGLSGISSLERFDFHKCLKEYIARANLGEIDIIDE